MNFTFLWISFVKDFTVILSITVLIRLSGFSRQILIIPHKLNFNWTLQNWKQMFHTLTLHSLSPAYFTVKVVVYFIKINCPC